MRLLCSALLLAGAAFAGLRSDIEFARPGGEPLTLDAFVPEGAGPFPAVIVVHGGGFIRGDKQTYVPPLFDPLSRGGFAWFTINYRLAPKHPFPAGVEDVEAAIRWVKKNAASYKVDPRRIALMGESAGGHLVSFAGARAKGKTRVAAVVSFYGPHDFVTRARAQKSISESAQAFLGVTEVNAESEAVMRKASPITYVHQNMPPYLLIHGTKDPQVPYEQSVEMCAKMREAGARCELFTVAGAGHGVGGWEKEPAFQDYKRKMVEWLRAELR